MDTFRKFSRVLGTAAALTLAASVGAHATGAGVADVQIVDRSDGRVLRIHYYEGRAYVVGRPGAEYAVRVANHSAGRVLAVMSVDGVNVITGDTASSAQSGYVLGAGETAEIAGWRKSMARTAAFFFAALPDSYAARTGRADNVGVIGVAVFNERPLPTVPPMSGYLEHGRGRMSSAERADSASSGPAAPAPLPDSANARSESSAADTAKRAQAPSEAMAMKPAERLGTGHGRSEQSLTRYTHFDRASPVPIETIAIYYDSYENLLAQGIPVGGRELARNNARPFPGVGHFAPDPR